MLDPKQAQIHYLPVLLQIIRTYILGVCISYNNHDCQWIHSVPIDH